MTAAFGTALGLMYLRTVCRSYQIVRRRMALVAAAAAAAVTPAVVAVVMR